MVVQKAIGDLERVGDEVRKLANLRSNFCDVDKPPSGQPLRDIFNTAACVDGMLEKALKAFETHDLILAMQVVREDDDLYEGFRAALRRMPTFLIEDARSVGRVVDIVAQEDRPSVYPAAGRPMNRWTRDRRMPGTKCAF